MSDLSVSIGVGATMQGSVGTVVGGTVRHLDKLRKSTEALQQRTQRITAFRELGSDLAKTRTRARQATERVVKMGAAMRRIKQPSQEMRDALGKARAEAKRLNDRVSEQTTKLGQVRRQMRQAGDAVKGLDARERGLNKTLATQRRRLERLQKGYAARDAARSRRAGARGQLFDAAALGVSVLAPIVGATRAAIRFESVMADVRKVVDFDTPEQFAQMGQDVLKLSERMPVAAAGIGDIIAAAGQAGIAREELNRFAEDASKVAIAFDISGGEAGGRLTGLRSIFKLNQDEVMALAGTYNHLSNNMDATAPAMLNVAERTGSVATQFGLTGEQTGALAATFLALKTPPEVAGTAINSLLVKLGTAAQQPKKFQEALDELGLSADELKDDIEQDAQGALLKFLETVDSAEDKQEILFALFGQEYVDDITKLAGGLDIYRDALGLSADKTAAATSIQKEYEARAKTTENQLQLLKNKTNVLGVNIGSVLLPSVNSVVGGLGEFVSKGAALAKEFPGATRVVIGLVGGLVGLKVISAFGGYAATFLAEGWALGRIAMYRAAGGAAWLGRSLRGLSLRSIPTAIGSLKWLRLALIGTGLGAAVVAIGVGCRDHHAVLGADQGVLRGARRGISRGDDARRRGLQAARAGVRVVRRHREMGRRRVREALGAGECDGRAARGVSQHRRVGGQGHRESVPHRTAAGHRAREGGRHGAQVAWRAGRHRGGGRRQSRGGSPWGQASAAGRLCVGLAPGPASGRCGRRRGQHRRDGPRHRGGAGLPDAIDRDPRATTARPFPTQSTAPPVATTIPASTAPVASVTEITAQVREELGGFGSEDAGDDAAFERIEAGVAALAAGVGADVGAPKTGRTVRGRLLGRCPWCFTRRSISRAPARRSRTRSRGAWKSSCAGPASKRASRRATMPSEPRSEA